MQGSNCWVLGLCLKVSNVGNGYPGPKQPRGLEGDCAGGWGGGGGWSGWSVAPVNGVKDPKHGNPKRQSPNYAALKNVL